MTSPYAPVYERRPCVQVRRGDQWVIHSKFDDELDCLKFAVQLREKGIVARTLSASGMPLDE